MDIDEEEAPTLVETAKTSIIQERPLDPEKIKVPITIVTGRSVSVEESLKPN